MRSIIAAVVATSVSLVSGQTKPVHRVDSLMGQLTLDEKITLLGGVESMFTRPIERLGIPRIKMTDGPNGTRVWGKSTAYPAGVLLAATWDRELAQREGEQLGRDARARGCHVLLAPGMNIYRHPRNGRNFEYFGEDPLLAGEIAIGYVKGVESQHVSTTVKHFAMNNQETDRMTGSSEADERTIREIYFPAFKRVIEQAKPGAVMCSYNRINGTWASENGWLLNDVLRGEWKFDGIVMSDWGAVHGTIGPLNNGLDLEMPGPRFLNEKNIKPLLESGVVSRAAIDTKVRRLLTWMDRYGWLDRDITDESIPKDNPDGDKVALDVARDGITLLKNEGDLLPLDKTNLKRVVVIGPNAIKTPVGGGGSGYTDPFHSVSIADGLKAALGGRLTVIGEERMLAALEAMAKSPAVDGGKFSAEYFENQTLTGSPAITRDETAITFDAPRDKPAISGMKANKFSARYRATITPEKTASYTFFTRADDGARVTVDGKTIVDDWSDHGVHLATGAMELEAGKKHEVVVEYYDAGGAATLSFGCGLTQPTFTDEEVAQIREADAVVACVGFGPENESEGSDRTYTLPAGQDELLAAATTANPKTIVVLNAGGSVDMTKWIDKAPGLLHAFYAGQNGGTAIAQVLLGHVNPSGRLPFTIEKQLSDVPSEGHWGEKGPVEYVEGVFVGYRGFERRNVEPRFPFGFGLSYTKFSIESATAAIKGDVIDIVASVTNAGPRDGATVVQCYVEPPAGELPRPVKELKAFEKVSLKQGEKKTLQLQIPRSDLAYWDPAKRAWTVAAGTYKVHVGTNARDIAQTAIVELK